MENNTHVSPLLFETDFEMPDDDIMNAPEKIRISKLLKNEISKESASRILSYYLGEGVLLAKGNYGCSVREKTILKSCLKSFFTSH